MRNSPHRVPRPLCLVVLAFAAACRCGGGGADAGRTVDVVRFRTLLTEGHREDVPFDLNDLDVSAIVFDDGGALVVYPEIVGAGLATFYGMPDSGYVLRLNGYNLVTEADRVDLGVVSLGRASVPLTDGGSTVLQLDVAGLQPWQPYSDVLQLTSANAGYVAINAQAYAGDPPDAGATDASFPLRYWAACSTPRGELAPLIDADAGDVAVLTQLVNGPVGDAGTLELRALVRSAELMPFTMVDQATNVVAVPLAPVATQEHLTLDFRQSEFDAQRSAVHPMANALSSTVTVSVLPHSSSDGFYAAAPDLAVLRPQQLSQDVALTFDTGNPFPAAWAKVVSVRYAVQVDVQFPDGGLGRLTTALVTQDLLPAGSAPALKPLVTPPRSLKVDGADGRVRAQISRLPRLSWQPPAVGTPTSYGITIFKLARVGSGPIIAVSEEVFWETTETSLDLPFGEVVPGGEYVFGVTAIMSPGADVKRRPFKGGFPYGAATALTALLRVDPAVTSP